MRGLFTGIGTAVLVVLVAVFTLGGVFGFVSGLFDNSDLGAVVGVVVSIIYLSIVAQLGILLSVLAGAIVHALFDN